MVDNPTFLALSKTSISSRAMFYVSARDENDDLHPFGFWTGVGDKSIDVVSGQTWETEERDFFGGGRLVSYGNFGSTIGLESRAITVMLAASSPEVQDLIRGYRIRRAPAELLMAQFDPVTGFLVSDPYPVFVGQVDTAKVKLQGSNVAEVRVVSETIELTLTNPAKKSHAQQVLESDDDFRQYGDLAGRREIWWGEFKKRVSR